MGSGLLEMGRRAFLGGVAGSAALVAMGARAQQAPPVVALVSGHLPVDVMIEGEDGDPGWAAFLAEMRTQGFVEGETVTYTRTSGIQYMASIRLQGRRLQGLSRNYLEGATAVFTDSYWVGVGAGIEDGDTPVVIATDDVLGTGLVASVEKPGGKVTGVTTAGGYGAEGTRLELLSSAVPGARTVAYMIRDQSASPTMAGEALIGAAQDAAGRLNKNLVIAFVSNMMNDPVMDATQWQRAFFDAAAAGPDALVVAQQRDPLNTPATIGGLAFAAKLPAIAPWRAFAEAGGLMSYGANQAAAYARGAQQVAVVLRGAASPADIPVQQPEMELVVNAQAAAHIGITIPDLVMSMATEVIS